MTNPIEFAARTAAAGLKGVTAPGSSAAQMDARGGELVRDLAKGGLALGAGTGAVVALLNYLKSMREENELEDEARMNDDTLYIPAVKSAADGSVNRWLAPGLAVTGGILSAGGAYALTQQVYNYLQKKRRQAMLDEAQGEALAASDTEIAKAAAQMNFSDLVTAFPVAIPLLAAMASGGVAYAALKKTFPTVKSPASKYPKRIRQVAQDGTVEDLPDDVDPTTKSASDYAAEADLEDAGLEFLILAVDQTSREKRAAHRVTSDILSRVAIEGLHEVTRMQKEGGIAALTESVRGASATPVDLARKVLAAAAICKSARLRPIMSAIAAAELQELAPDLYDTTVAYGEEQLDKFAGLAPLLQIACFRPMMIEKSAMSSNPALLEELVSMLTARHGSLGGEDGEMAVSPALNSDVNGAGAVESEGDTAEGDVASDVESADPVDQLLADDAEASPILDPAVDDDEEQAGLHSGM